MPPAKNTDKSVDVELPVPSVTHENTGKGSDDVPPSDFVSFATEDVEKTPSDIASDVLKGKYGYVADEALSKVETEGHDVAAVRKELKRLIASGVPSTLVS